MKFSAKNSNVSTCVLSKFIGKLGLLTAIVWLRSETSYVSAALETRFEFHLCNLAIGFGLLDRNKQCLLDMALHCTTW